MTNISEIFYDQSQLLLYNHNMERGNVFDELRKEILDLTLKPGTELNLNQLSTIFGVSRSPVRDAVKELAGEHLIDIYPQRGTYVSRINLRMADDERFIRLNLELGSIPDFIENVNDDLISEMEDLIEKQEKAFALRDTSLLLKLDDQFHSIIFRGAEGHRLPEGNDFFFQFRHMGLVQGKKPFRVLFLYCLKNKLMLSYYILAYGVEHK